MSLARLALVVASFGTFVTGCDGDDVGRATTATTVFADIVEVDPVGADDLARSIASVGLPSADPIGLPDGAVGYAIEVPGAEAIDAWRSLRSIVAETGHYPVVGGGPVEFDGSIVYDEAQLVLDNAAFLAEDGASTEDALATAATLDVERWWIERQEYLGLFDDELVVDELPAWDGPNDVFTVGRDVLTGEPLGRVTIFLLPTTLPWEAPAYLLWGAWNDVPQPGELTAVFEHWYEAYGAEVVAMTSDVVEMRVARPPTDDAGAIELAIEQYHVAPDIVWQGFGDVDALAAAVRGAPVWSFWWD